MINNICIFGDSVAKGVVLNAESGKYVLLRDSFANRVMEEEQIQVRNFSRFGSTVTRGLETLEKRRGELKDYDHVVLEFGGNDCDYNWAQIAADPEGSHQPNTRLGDFTGKYAEMVRIIREAGSRPVLLSLPPIDAQRYFRWVSRGISGENILRWLGDVEHIYRWHEMYNLAVARLAAALDVPFADITSPFLETKDYGSLLCGDGIHPNESGHALIGSVLTGELSRRREACAC
jgi:acyl-CoA thioesterase-1